MTKSRPMVDKVIGRMTAEEFNAAVPVGTKVDWFPVIGRPDFPEFTTTRTKTAAWKGGSHVSVMLEGVSGSVPLASIRLHEQEHENVADTGGHGKGPSGWTLAQTFPAKKD